ncbi:MAG: VOC family protein [Clostridia bacterium]|nr:VOC family protein [Clostridia bacterium]
MKYKNTLIAVADMEASKRFYHDVMGLKVIADFGANVTLDGGIVLQTMDTWRSFLKTDEITLPNNAAELYFEETDMDAFCRYLQGFKIHYLHGLFEHRWGQRVVRFYDPDHHIIEVGESLSAVVARFKEQGLSPEEIAVRMDIPLDFVISCLREAQE